MAIQRLLVTVQIPPLPLSNPLNLTTAPAAAPLNLTALQVVTSAALPAGTPPSGRVTVGATGRIILNSNDFQKLRNEFLNNPGKNGVNISYDDVTFVVVDFEGFAAQEGIAA